VSYFDAVLFRDNHLKTTLHDGYRLGLQLDKPVGTFYSPDLRKPVVQSKALYESGDHLNHVYFPTTAIVSLLYELEDGASAEIAVVGIVGIALFMVVIPCRIGQ